MAGCVTGFGDFELAGWEDPSVVAKYDEQLSRVTTQSVNALLDGAGIRDGSRVLDVATGGGYIAAAAAQRGAEATGIDFSVAQLKLARARFSGVRFEHADAEALPFEGSRYDAVVSGFGLCHLPHPDRALAEAFRVLKPGGRVAFTVWDVPERAVVFGAFYDAVRAHGSMNVGLPEGPNFFLLSDPDECARALLNAGFDAPSCRQVHQVWCADDPDQLLGALAEGTVRAAALLRAQSPRAREAIKSALHSSLSPYKRGERFEVPAPAVLAVAVKPQDGGFETLH